MAGNLVKWWKHKILGGYKQFSVQECTTDSEELMYHQVRAPSSCSAPPDLLLVSDRENNIPLKTPSPSPSPVVNIITTAAATACAAASGSGQKHQHASHPHQQHLQPQHQHQPHPHQQQHSSGAKELFNKNAHNSKMSSGRNGGKFINLQASTGNHHSHQQTEAGQQQQQQHQSRHHAKEERIHLEEFTCDVSVEGGKSSQPLQFSFTFYDLDGHHGKITKDDIVGIVYTIYESIGKSVVVPHCGSKTINVRLTVSPEGKSKAAASATAANKLKKMQLEGGKTAGHAASTAAVAAAAAANQGLGHSRRQHRYRPRKLIKSDDEDDDSTSEKDLQLTAMAAAAASATAAKSKSHAGKYNNRMKLEQQQQHGAAAAGNCCQSAENNRNLENHMDASAEHNLYANVAPKRSDGHGDECRRCTATTTTTPVSAAPAGTTGAQRTSDMYLKQASTRVKMLRKARKQKYQDHCLETRQRSLSVGSEACWKSRHSKSSPHHLLDALSPTTSAVGGQQHGPAAEDTVDGVQLRGGHRPAGPRPTTTTAAVNRSSAECWNTALNRNDLISIIRESMEKNRLCFQLNGKPQASVSPIRQSQQRQRSNTVSKIPTLIANHSSSIISYNNTSHIHNISSSNNNYNINSNHHSHNSNNINNNSSSNNFIPNDTNIHDISSTGYQQHQQHQLQQHQQQQQQQQHQHHHSHHHLQPHIPIYHQQMAINPAVLAAQSGIGHAKMNLCGYDSFLHATICGGGTSHSPPPPPVPPTVSCIAAPHTQQPIAAVQPIMTAIGHNHHQQQLAAKVFAHPTPTTNLIKTSKILRSGTFSQSHGATPASGAAQSSPLYHGYQRLSSGPGAASAAATRHNLAALNSQNPSMEKAQVEHLEKWLHEREQCAGNALKSQKSRKDAKNYDSLLLAKLTERLQDSTLAAAEKQHQQQHEAGQRRKQRTDKAQKRSAVKRSGENAEVTKQLQKAPLSPETSDNSTYATLIPINGDPIECETLLGGQTSDEETSTELPLSPAVAAIATVTAAAAAAVSAPVVDSAEARKTGTAEERHVQTGDLLHLNDDEETAGEVGPKAEGTGRDSSSCGQSDGSGAAVVATCTANGAHNSSSTSSLIHRYVHEHIHHHYHHFEDKDE